MKGVLQLIKRHQTRAEIINITIHHFCRLQFILLKKKTLSILIFNINTFLALFIKG